MSLIVQVFGCRHDEAIYALRRPASEKRQGTKSREVGHRRCRGRYGDLAAVGDLSAMCRFSDAGMTRLSTRCGGRRPKSAKARNRGKWGTGGAAGAYGDLAAVR